MLDLHTAVTDEFTMNDPTPRSAVHARARFDAPMRMVA